MAGRSRYKASEVLQQMLDIPSDKESVDGMEDDEDGDFDNATTFDNIFVADNKSVTISTSTDDEEDDADILYQLVEPFVSWSDSETTESSYQ